MENGVMKIQSLYATFYRLVLIVLLACCVVLTPPAEAQRTGTAQPSEDDPEAAAAQEELAPQEDDAERQREAQERRRRGPNLAKMSFGDKDVIVQYGDWETDGPDYAPIDSLEAGDVVRGTMNAALKIKTDVNLKVGYGDAVITTENVAKNYPGVYSMWIRKTEDGWSLIFNEKADVWGTMHDPETDIAEIPLDYEDSEEPNEKMEVSLEARDGGAMIRIWWGKHQWIAAIEPLS